MTLLLCSSTPSYAINCRVNAGPNDQQLFDTSVRAYERQAAEFLGPNAYGEGRGAWAEGSPVLIRKTAQPLTQTAQLIHLVGAVKVAQRSRADARSVLADFNNYGTIYSPDIVSAKVSRGAPEFDVTALLFHRYRIPLTLWLVFLDYSFQVKFRCTFSETADQFTVAVSAYNIQESESGDRGRTSDLRPQFDDHGILWGLATWWRVRQSGQDLWLEYDTMSLARSLSGFECKVGLIRISESSARQQLDAFSRTSMDHILRATSKAIRARK